MGKVLFKAKKKDNNQWKEGFYREWDPSVWYGEKKPKNYFIDTEQGDSELIYPQTVCQRLHDICWYFEGNEAMQEQITDAWQNDVIEMRMSDGVEYIGFVDMEFGNLIFVSNSLLDGYINLNEFSEELEKGTFEAVDGVMYIKAKYLGNRFDNAELLGDKYESHI